MTVFRVRYRVVVYQLRKYTCLGRAFDSYVHMIIIFITFQHYYKSRSILTVAATTTTTMNILIIIVIIFIIKFIIILIHCVRLTVFTHSRYSTMHY